MEKRMSEAFSFMFKDNDWKFKMFILYLLSLVSYILAYYSNELTETIKATKNYSLAVPFVGVLILSFVLSLPILGYSFKSINNLIYSQPQSENFNMLPRWENDFFSYIMVGLRYIGASLLIGLCVGLLFIAVSAIASVSKLFLSILMIVLIILALIYAYYFPALEVIFAMSYDFLALFKVKKAAELVKYGTSKYIRVLLLISLVSIIFSIISALCAKSILLIILVPIINVYTFFVYVYLKSYIAYEVPAEFVEQFKAAK